MTRANRILFDKIKTRWEITKMKLAYIMAEKEIMQNPALTQWDESNALDQVVEQRYHSDGLVESKTVRDIQIEKLEKQLEEVEETARKLLENENYELMHEAQDLYDTLKRQLNRLRSGKS